MNEPLRDIPVPDSPREITDEIPCQSGAAGMDCEWKTTWRVVAWYPEGGEAGEWVRMVTCGPCLIELINRKHVYSMTLASGG